MAQLLGSKYCIRSLRDDVTDVQSSVLELLSRVGPMHNLSWKYPNRTGVSVDVSEVLMRYDYIENGKQAEEERQIAHIVLMEMVIDRLLLLLQATDKYIEQMEKKQNIRVTSAESRAGSASGSSSVGPTVKKYLQRLLTFCNTTLQLPIENTKLHEQNCGVERRMTPTDMNNSAADPRTAAAGVTGTAAAGLTGTAASGLTGTAAAPGPAAAAGHAAGTGVGHAAAAAGCARLGPGTDEYSKACQTVDTMFSSCDSCDVTHSCLRQVAESLVTACHVIGVTSHIQQHRDSVTGLAWLSGSDVLRWSKEQNKDLELITRSVSEMRSTVDDLKVKLSKEQKKNRTLTNSLLENKKQAELERETLSAAQRKYNSRIQEIEKLQEQARDSSERQMRQWSTERIRLETELSLVKSDLRKHVEMNKHLEQSLLAAEHEAEERVKQRYEEREKRSEKRLRDIEIKLEEKEKEISEMRVDLNKERLKNESSSKHSQSIQSRQRSLIQRVGEMDQENEELRERILELQQNIETLKHQHITTLEEKRKQEKQISDMKLDQSERSSTAAVQSLQQLDQSESSSVAAVQRLQQLLHESSEREKLLVNYPHLHHLPDDVISVIRDIETSNRKHSEIDVMSEMRSQMKANEIRVRLLREENERLNNSIDKLSQVRREAWSEGLTTTTTAPIALWMGQGDTSDRSQRSTSRDSGLMIKQQSQQTKHQYTRLRSAETCDQSEHSYDSYSVGGSDQGEGLQGEFVVGRPPLKGVRPNSASRGRRGDKNPSRGSNRPHATNNSSIYSRI